MPGREVLPSRSGVASPTSATTATTTARRAATATSTAPYRHRRPPLSTSSLSSAHASSYGRVATRRGASSPPTSAADAAAAAAAPPPPACAECVACYRASESVMIALTEVLANAKRLLLDDAMHHYSGDEAWIRVLRALGWTELEKMKAVASSTPT